MKYELYLYDVWGNDEDGYVVNDVIPTGIKFDDYAPSKKRLCEILKLDDPYKMDADDTNDDVIFVDYEGKPYCELREVTENVN